MRSPRSGWALERDLTFATQDTLTVEMTGELAEPVAAVTGLTQLCVGGRNARERAGRAATGGESAARAGGVAGAK